MASGYDDLLILVAAGGFAVIAGLGTRFLLLSLQTRWNAAAEKFARKDKAVVQELVGSAESVVGGLLTSARRWKEQYAETGFHLLILEELCQVAALFHSAVPQDEEGFKASITKVLMVAVHSLLPTSSDARAELLIYDGHSLVQYCAFVPDGAPPFSGAPITPGQDAAGICFVEKKSVIAEDSRAVPASNVSGHVGCRSLLCVPFPSANGDPAGVLCVDTLARDYFNEQHARMLAAVSNLVFSMWRTWRTQTAPGWCFPYHADVREVNVDEVRDSCLAEGCSVLPWPGRPHGA
ncbi:MAG: GAF domain-containing protein [Firmicutes bacterium]|jgi:hypothetical protein|nr:GAF domain-containing protein [Bacillota bacterium]